MTRFSPCKKWQDYLASQHAEDLSDVDRVLLQSHLDQCSACAHAYEDYAYLARSIRALPDPAFQPLINLNALIRKDQLQQLSTPKRESSFKVQISAYAKFAVAAIIIGLLSFNAYIGHAQMTQFDGNTLEQNAVQNAPSMNTIQQQTANAPCYNVTLQQENGERTTLNQCDQYELQNIDQSQSSQDYTVTLKQAFLNNYLTLGYELKQNDVEASPVWHPIIEVTSPSFKEKVALDRFMLLRQLDASASDSIIAYGSYQMKEGEVTDFPLTVQVTGVKNYQTGEVVTFDTALTFEFTLEPVTAE